MLEGCQNMKKKVAAFTTVALLSSAFGANAMASTYQVQKGDTLTKIATKYSTSVEQLKALNSLTSDLIYINQTLKVADNGAPSTIPASNPIPPKKTDQQAPTASTYTVVKGDTLGKIANDHNISLSNLMEWNQLNHHIIYPGQKLAVTGSSNMDKVNTEPKQEPAPSSPVSNITDYTVQKGDTLSHISVKTGVSVADLKQWNQLTSDIIYVGQKLKIKTTSVPGSDRPVSPPKEEPASIENADSLITQAKTLIGVPYVWGGSTVSGFDCSGFIYYAFQSIGSEVGRLSTDGYYSRSYYVNTPAVGDLVFFENTYKKGISHMGIYIGNNEFIHASSSKGVTISNLNETYYKQRFDGFKRFY